MRTRLIEDTLTFWGVGSPSSSEACVDPGRDRATANRGAKERREANSQDSARHADSGFERHLVSVGVSAWNLHGHRYYRVRNRFKYRTLAIGPIRVVLASYRILANDHFDRDDSG